MAILLLQISHLRLAILLLQVSHVKLNYLSFATGIIRVYAGGQQPNQRSVGSNVITADVIVDKHVIVTV